MSAPSFVELFPSGLSAQLIPASIVWEVPPPLLSRTFALSIVAPGAVLVAIPATCVPWPLWSCASVSMKFAEIIVVFSNQGCEACIPVSSIAIFFPCPVLFWLCASVTPRIGRLSSTNAMYCISGVAVLTSSSLASSSSSAESTSAMIVFPTS